MTHDELRKKAWDLEIALGKSMKLNDELAAGLKTLERRYVKMCDLNIHLYRGIKEYINTMNKQKLFDLINSSTEMSKNLK